MPKIKLPRKSTIVDMTAMCDVAFLLLTFFILTAKFKPPQSVIIDLPSSRSQTKVPDPLMTISVDREGKVYYTLSSTTLKRDALNNMIDKYGNKYAVLNNLTEQQKNKFIQVEMLGADVNQLPDLLNRSPAEINEIEMPGIPIDSANNQLGDWIMSGRYANPKMRIAIKGDKESDVKTVQEVIKTLTDRDINTFNLITMLEGTAAAAPAENN
jgi:biopolymer transport protein ExbD